MKALFEKNLTFSEREIARRLVKALPEGGRVVVSRVAVYTDASRSVAVNVLKKLAMAGVVETRSLGVKGTFIRVLDMDAWQSLAKED